MHSWHSKQLGDALLAEPLLAQLKLDFKAYLAQKNCTENSAVFYRHESEGRLHCELVLYFSPAASALAALAQAKPCAQPQAQGLALFFGSEHAAKILFNASENTGK